MGRWAGADRVAQAGRPAGGKQAAAQEGARMEARMSVCRMSEHDDHGSKLSSSRNPQHPPTHTLLQSIAFAIGATNYTLKVCGSSGERPRLAQLWNEAASASPAHRPPRLCTHERLAEPLAASAGCARPPATHPPTHPCSERCTQGGVGLHLLRPRPGHDLRRSRLLGGCMHAAWTSVGTPRAGACLLWARQSPPRWLRLDQRLSWTAAPLACC